MADDLLADRTLPETLPTPAAVGAKHDEIGFSGVGMQHDHAGGIALLLDNANRHTGSLRSGAQLLQQVESFDLTR